MISFLTALNQNLRKDSVSNFDASGEYMQQDLMQKYKGNSGSDTAM